MGVTLAEVDGVGDGVGEGDELQPLKARDSETPQIATKALTDRLFMPSFFTLQ